MFREELGRSSLLGLLQSLEENLAFNSRRRINMELVMRENQLNRLTQSVREEVIKMMGENQLDKTSKAVKNLENKAAHCLRQIAIGMGLSDNTKLSDLHLQILHRLEGASKKTSESSRSTLRAPVTPLEIKFDAQIDRRARISKHEEFSVTDFPYFLLVSQLQRVRSLAHGGYIAAQSNIKQ